MAFHKTTANLQNVALRIPGLFLLEYVHHLELKSHPYISSALENYMHSSAHIYLEWVVYIIGILIAVLLLVLPIEKITSFYKDSLLVFCLCSLHLLSANLINSPLRSFVDWKYWHEFWKTFALFCLKHNLAFVLEEKNALLLVAESFLTLICGHFMRKMNFLCVYLYYSPLIARLSGLPDFMVEFLHLLTVLVTSFYIIHLIVAGCLNQIDFSVKLYHWGVECVQQEGVLVFLHVFGELFSLQIILLSFWIVFFIYNLSFEFYSNSLFEGFLLTLSGCCSSPISVLGFAVTASYLSHILQKLTIMYLAHGDEDREYLGLGEGFVVLVLCLQTHILDYDDEQKPFLLSIILFIVLGSTLQSMFEVLQPVLLSTAHSPRILQHIRCLVLAAFLFLAPVFLTRFFLENIEMDSWFFIFASSCLITSLQVVAAVAVYFLFIFDSKRPFPQLDDAIYYINAASRTAEFIIAVAIVFYGVVDAFTTEWSFVNAGVLGMHAYLAVYDRARQAWLEFLKRRHAVKRLARLKTVSSDKLKDEVCTICLAEFDDAVVTSCGHFFHATCLKKWLYVQPTCPLCHQQAVSENPIPIHNEETSSLPESGVVNTGACGTSRPQGQITPQQPS